MTRRWSFFAFDWDRFRELEPVLRSASESGDFSALQSEEAQEILDGMPDDATSEEACNELILQLCSTGEALTLESGLAALIRRIRRHRRGEEAAELLGLLVSGEPNIEDWYRAEGGLVGILTEEQTRELDAALKPLRGTVTPAPKPAGIAALAHRLSTAEDPSDRLNELMDMIHEAAAQHGLGLLRED